MDLRNSRSRSRRRTDRGFTQGGRRRTMRRRRRRRRRRKVYSKLTQ